jgi:hypothetical protein
MALSIAVDAPPAPRAAACPRRLASTVTIGSGHANRPKVESADRVLELDE